MNFDFIDKCYEVEEQIYDPEILREVLTKQIESLRIRLHNHEFRQDMRGDYDFVVWATYGLGPSRGLFKSVKYQVAEKILIELPKQLQGVSLVVVDGPFTAFDPYGSSERSLWGSAKNTNHWTTTDPNEPIPEQYRAAAEWAGDSSRLRGRASRRCGKDAMLAVPASAEAKYLGSRFTIRVVENNPNAGSADAVCAGDRAGRDSHLLGEGGERGEGGAHGERDGWQRGRLTGRFVSGHDVTGAEKVGAGCLVSGHDLGRAG